MNLLVADASPLIGLAKAGQLDLLPKLFAKVFLPPAVFDDVVVRGRDRPGAQEVSSAPWIEVRCPTRSLADPGSLGEGEAQAIALAKELGADLLVDDRSAKARAEQDGITCSTITRLLSMAYRLGLIAEIGPILDKLEAEHFGVPVQARQELLRFTGEET